ncbi:mechanosensitive ion channel family protein [Sphingorhabdus soli]|uniref:Small-conductance mechanosensitive channel n=1 Tax=Flavisphingopyxis soli TaxID=2601267 RepID=A0A5C6U5I4_9SPHN|nr:mechanosensitive ion channel family protein [Sphingorhabdus soli]TXC68094.1 mechanosensitive ion channel family protein [Sphingorhabdus soli]
MLDATTIINQQMQNAYTGFIALIPALVAAVFLVVIVWVVGRVVRRGVVRLASRRGRPDLGQLLGSLTFGAIMVLALLSASAIVFPTVHPGDIVAALGIGSVAIGFAFKDILQNLLAGLLLLIRRPYRRGDQIVVKGFEGTVEHIESRATLIMTYDGRRVIIPNGDVYTSPVIVNTAFDFRRDQVDIGIGYADSPSQAARYFLEAIAAVEGVESDPAPQVLPWALNDSTVDLRARWWTSSHRTDQVLVRSRIVLAIYEAAKAHGIDLPFPTQVMLFHDQTEESDGDRARQREGWPAGDAPPRPRRFKSEILESDEKPAA